MILVDGKVFKVDIESILERLQQELTNGKLRTFKRKTSGISVPCPVHNGGMEKHPSCYINDDGIWHCFACGSRGGIDSFVAHCFEIDLKDARKWLYDRFEFNDSDKEIDLQPIVVNKKNEVKTLDESILDTYQSFHPYMTKRKLSQEICEKFSVKYDSKSESLVFPVWDERGKLVLLTRRSVKNKTFMIDANVEKPVYLLNFIEKEGIKDVIVCESQINALYCWTLGYPAIALFGTGSEHQYQVLNNCGIRHYTLAFDGDDAGNKGRDRFLHKIRNDVFVDYVNLPKGMDLNDLDKNEVKILLNHSVF